MGIVGHDVAANLVPVPEPETYAMLLAGLGLIGFVGYRRKQVAAI
ncbi:MAG: PEP-CTERM sorting domain-containing protein [Betaproteobacteria bacterium]|nr:PEP-CTERM sorting domain-containing protein [Betaproteobacteria bacterium]